MSTSSPTYFASACAFGTDWRDTCKQVLDQLDTARNQSHNFNFGFLYVSDHLSEDVTSILNLFKSVLKIDDWVGSVGMGVIATSQSVVDKPAISAMIGHFPKNSFCVFPDMDDDIEDSTEPTQDRIEEWFANHMPMLSIVHGDPMAEEDPRATLKELEKSTGSFLVGGLTSSRSRHFQIANTVVDNAVCGAFFANTIEASTTLSQGCNPISGFHTITKSDENAILELDDRKALDVLQENLQSRAREQGDISSQSLESLSQGSDQIPEAFKGLFAGQIHVALPLSQSDQKDYLVRNIVAIDADEGSISISENMNNGEHILFTQRNDQTVISDLSKTLIALRKRIEHERGIFKPKAALYFSCVARAFAQDNDNKVTDAEIELLRDIIGEIPMTGFYAGGEINNARIYGYTGVLVLFF